MLVLGAERGGGRGKTRYPRPVGILRWLGLERTSEESAAARLARVKAHPLLAEAGYRSAAGGTIDEVLCRDVESLAGLDDAEPLLIRLAEEQPIAWLRAAATRALRARATPAARETAARQDAYLVGRLHRRVELSPAEVEDNARRAREEGDPVLRELAVRALWHVANDRSSAELRSWLPLAAALRGDDEIGEAARAVLRRAPREEALRLVAEIRGSATRPRVVEQTPRTEWDVLAAKPTLTADERARAEVVCRDLMEKVARNADRVTERLGRLGWPLPDIPRATELALAVPRRNAFTGQLVAPPASAEVKLAEIEETVVSVPLAVATFWRVVGGIDWAAGEAQLPGWAAPTGEWLDPLVVYPAAFSEHWLDAWTEDLREYTSVELAGPCVLRFSPDHTGKRIPGDDRWYEILLPSTDLDPVVRNARERLRFVPYLRNAFRWGGLPGLAYVERSAELDAVLARLTEGLEPF